MTKVLLLVLAGALPARAADDMARGLKLKGQGNLLAAEAAFERAVASNPKDVDALSQLAVVQGWQKRYDRSIATWEKALKLAPRCGECRVGLARVLFWSGERAKALTRLEQALAANPSDVDALILRGDVLAASGRTEEAKDSYMKAKSIAPETEGLARKLEQTVAVPLWRVDAGFISDHYSRLRGVEYDAYGQFGRTFPQRGSAWFRFDHQQQFSLIDRTFQVGGAYRAAPRLLILADYAATPRNLVRSRYQFDFGGEVPLPFVTPLFNYRRMNYANGAIDIYTPGVRLEPAPWVNTELRFGISHNLNNTKTFSTSVRANFFIGDAYAPYVSFTHGSEAIPPEAEAFSNYITTGLVVNISRSWGLRLDYAFEDRRGYYSHHSTGLGVSFKF